MCWDHMSGPSSLVSPLTSQHGGLRVPTPLGPHLNPHPMNLWPRSLSYSSCQTDIAIHLQTFPVPDTREFKMEGVPCGERATTRTVRPPESAAGMHSTLGWGSHSFPSFALRSPAGKGPKDLPSGVDALPLGAQRARGAQQRAPQPSRHSGPKLGGQLALLMPHWASREHLPPAASPSSPHNCVLSP